MSSTNGHTNGDNGFSEKQRSIHANSIANLIRFQPGQSGNPGGVKKGQVFVSEAYKRLLCLNPQELAEYQPANVAEAIALRQIISGIYGQDALPSAKEITDRTEGKAPQKLSIEQIPAPDLEERIEAAIVRMMTRMAEQGHIIDRAVAEEAVLAQPEFREPGKIG